MKLKAIKQYKKQAHNNIKKQNIRVHQKDQETIIFFNDLMTKFKLKLIKINKRLITMTHSTISINSIIIVHKNKNNNPLFSNNNLKKKTIHKKKQNKIMKFCIIIT